MKDSPACNPLGYTGDFFPVDQNVIAPAGGSLNTQRGQRPADRFRKAADGQLFRIPDIFDE